MVVVTTDELRANKTREKLYVLLHGKGASIRVNQSHVVLYAHSWYSL
jgi:hypothetical protein